MANLPVLTFLQNEVPQNGARDHSSSGAKTLHWVEAKQRPGKSDHRQYREKLVSPKKENKCAREIILCLFLPLSLSAGMSLLNGSLSRMTAFAAANNRQRPKTAVSCMILTKSKASHTK